MLTILPLKVGTKTAHHFQAKVPLGKRSATVHISIKSERHSPTIGTNLENYVIDPFSDLPQVIKHGAMQRLLTTFDIAISTKKV